MPSRTSRATLGLTALTAAGLSLALAACASSSPKASPSNPAPSAAASFDSSITVPAAIKSAGVLTVATDPSYAPNEFFASDKKTIIGMDVDLADALGATLGLKVEVEQAELAGIIPALAAGKYDLSLSSLTDNKEREKTVDFVTYFTAGTSLMVKDGNPERLTPDTLCGKKVAVEKGSVQENPDLPTRSNACTAAGEPTITTLSYPDQNGANLALSSGRADAVLADSPVADYAAKQSEGQLEVTGSSFNTAPYGIAIPRTNGLAAPILAALKELMANGTYQTILKEWGISDGAITDPKINGAIS